MPYECHPALKFLQNIQVDEEQISQLLQELSSHGGSIEVTHLGEPAMIRYDEIIGLVLEFQSQSIHVTEPQATAIWSATAS